jgi:hypothetical protein
MSKIQWKLDRLKEAIRRSGNVRNEIKALLGNVTINNFGVEVSRLSRDEIFKIYKGRYSYLESIGEQNESFADLIKRLEEVDNSVRLVITSLRTGRESYVVFTDKDYNECFGII